MYFSFYQLYRLMHPFFSLAPREAVYLFSAAGLVAGKSNLNRQ
jgi:hypothetical protein